MNRGKSVVAGLVLAISVVGVRLFNLSADPPHWLSWSAGIYTDEGFYAADARQAVLTGHWSPGNFHGAIISPVLYWLQLAAFHCFSPGLNTARGISVLCGSLTVLLLFVALRRLYGDRTAWVGAILLGFSTPFVLYNRLALMETPAAMLMTGALVCLAYCSRPATGVTNWNTIDHIVLAEPVDCERRLLALAGALIGLALVTKALLAPAVLVPVVWAWRIRKLRRLGWCAAGIGIPLILTAALWTCPYLTHLREMDRYYWTHQFSPHSFEGFLLNWKRALITGHRDGVMVELGYLDLALVASFLTGFVFAFRKWTDGDRLFAGWFFPMLIALASVSYTPSRYDVLILPAMAGLGARFIPGLPHWLTGSILVLFVAVQWVHVAPSLTRPTYSIRNSSAQLASIAPAGSVIVGQTAPELCMNSQLTPVMVQPGLANDSRPIERFGARYVLVTRSPFWDGWWRSRYPMVITAQNCVRTLAVGPAILVDVYRVPHPAGKASNGR